MTHNNLINLRSVMNAHPTAKEFIISFDQWDKAFDEYRDLLFSAYGNDIPFMADGHGYEAFVFHGKSVVRAIQ